MRRFIAAVLLVAGATSIPLTASIGVAGAQAPDAQGWWWLYRQPELPADPKALAPAFPDTPEVPPPASVPADGLYVAGSAAGPEAISALAWVIPEGASADTLTLVAAAPLTPTTKVLLCPTNISWQPTQAGRWSSKPGYVCAADAPVGEIPTDGSKITFKLGKLGQSQLIDVALVSADTAVFQANFNKPDKASLHVIPGATADVSAGGTGADVLGSSTAPGSLGAAINDPSYVPQLAPYLQQAPNADQQAIGAAPVVNFPQVVSGTPAAAAAPVKDNLGTFGIFGLIAVAAMFSRYRGQTTREPKSLVNFGKTAESDIS